MNVLTKTCKGFVKRAAACIVAGAVAATLIPAAVSAEGQAAEAALWETVSVIDMDGFTTTKEGSYEFEANKDVSGKNVILKALPEAPLYIMNKGTNFKDVPEDMAPNMPNIVKNNKLFVMDRNKANYNNSGWWRPTSCKAGIQLVNLIDTDKIGIGDRVKVTAYVYAKDLCIYDGTYTDLVENQEQNVSSRIWLTDPWKSNSEPGYNTACDPKKESKIGEVPANRWTEISLEFDVTSGNRAATSLMIDNYPGVDNGGLYPLLTYLAGVKVEKRVKTDSTYKKTVSSIDMDGFTKDEEKSGIWEGMFYDKTVDGWNYKVNGLVGSTSTVHGNTGIVTNLSSVTGSVPAITKNDTGFLMSRKYINGAPRNLPLSNTKIEVQNIFDTTKVQNGDRLKITAYVYASFLATSTLNSNGVYSLTTEGVTGQINYRMSLTGGTTEKVESKDDAAEWKEISVEYVVNDTNKSLNGIRIDNYVQNGEVYPLELYLAGVTVEKFENGGWYTVGENGNVSGEIYANNAGVTEGSKLMVAAYEGNTFLGCDILDINGEASPFSVTGAANADKVCAYVWDMTTLKPQAGVIGLTKAE